MPSPRHRSCCRPDHPAEAWFTSADATILAATKREPQDPASRPRHDMAVAMFDRLTPNWRDRDAVVAAYEAHNLAVREAIPAERLFEYQPGDGWGPLCARVERARARRSSSRTPTPPKSSAPSPASTDEHERQRRTVGARSSRPTSSTVDDETADERFYAVDRLLTHIDDGAIAAVSALYRELELDGDVLDICSSWISHFDPPPARLVALGMNPTELAANPAASSWVVRNLNDDPTLPFDDATFDAVTCCVASTT